MRKRLLIIDDNQDIRKSLCQLLVNLGYEVTTAANGIEGIEILDTTWVDGIFLDIQMPIMDGLTFLKWLKPWQKKIPIIVISGVAQEQVMIEALKNGARDYLIKPFDTDQLTQKCICIFGKPPFVQS